MSKIDARAQMKKVAALYREKDAELLKAKVDFEQKPTEENKEQLLLLAEEHLTAHKMLMEIYEKLPE